MIRTNIILTLILAISLAFHSCNKVVGKGPTVSETRSLNGFTKLSLDMDATIEVYQGNSFSVVVEAQQNVQNEILTTVSGQTLTVKHKNNTWIKSEPITVRITMPIINELSVSGSGSMLAQTSITGTNLELCVSGSGELILPGVNVETLQTDISGSGEINIKSGQTNKLDSEISGSGDLYSSYLVAAVAETHTSGSGTTKVYALNQLNAHISGSGNVYYRGNPTVNSSISGSGKVIHQD